MADSDENSQSAIDYANRAAVYMHKKYRNLDAHDPEAQKGEATSDPQNVVCPNCKMEINPAPIQKQINLPE